MKIVLGGGIAAAIAIASCSHKDDAPTYFDRSTMLDPETCKQCHATHYEEWSGSMHAYAADDPVFLAMNARGQRETNGALGTFCVKCHAPMAVREKATTDGTNLGALPKKLKGVTCLFCHSVSDVTDTHDNPLVLADDLTMRASYKDPVANGAHRAGYSALHDRSRLESSQLCGACHDIVNGHGVSLERTFDEWKKSVFASSPGGATCGQCHMAQSPNLTPIAQNVQGVFARRTHAHTFAGVDVALTPWPHADDQKQAVQSLLDTTLQTALCVAPLGGGASSLRVIVDNVAAGHSWPSGAVQDRRAWFEVVAYSGGNVIYQSGVVADGTAVTAANDPDLWLLRDCMFAGDKEVHMFWDALSLDGAQLPGQATFDQTDPRYYQTHVVQTWPRGNRTIMGVPDRVTLRVRLQPMGLDVLDDLVASGDLAKATRDAMTTWQVGKTLEWTPATATLKYMEDRTMLSCVSTTNLNVQADKVPATVPTKCKP